MRSARPVSPRFATVRHALAGAAALVNAVDPEHPGRPAVRVSVGGADRHGRPPAADRSGRIRPRPLSAATLRRLEDQLLDALLDKHPNCERALDRLAEDLGAVEVRGAQVRAAVASPARLHGIEELLVAAVLDAHPHSAESLDRLLGDLADRERDERTAREAFDAACDNDFDGLG